MDQNEPESNGNNLTEEAFQIYETLVKNTLNTIFRLSNEKNISDSNIEVQNIKLGKYIRSSDPKKEIIPIKSDDDFSPGSAFYLGGELVENGTERDFSINFVIDEEGRINTLDVDEQKIDINPEDTDDNKTLTEKATSFIKKNGLTIIGYILWAFEIFLRFIKKG